MGVVPEILQRIGEKLKGGSRPVESVQVLPRPDVYRFINGNEDTSSEAFRNLRANNKLSPRQIDDLAQMRHLRQREILEENKGNPPNSPDSGPDQPNKAA